MNTWCANHIGGVECPARGAPYQVLYPALARSRGPSGKEECTTSSKRSKPSLYRDANGMTRHAAAKQAETRLAQGRQQAPDGEHGGRADDHSSGAQRSHGNGCCCCTQSDRLDRSQLQEVIPAPSYLQLVNPWHTWWRSSVGSEVHEAHSEVHDSSWPHGYSGKAGCGRGIDGIGVLPDTALHRPGGLRTARSDWLRGGCDAAHSHADAREAEQAQLPYDDGAHLQLTLQPDPVDVSPSLRGLIGPRKPYHSHAHCAQRCLCKCRRFVPCVGPG